MQTRVIKSLIAAIGMVAAFSTAQAAELTGAGATFPQSIYSKWAEQYKAATGNVVNYQGIGSSGGIKQIKAKTVDFGGSDKPLKIEELEADGLTQFPTVIGGVVAIVNVEGVATGKLKLTGDVLAGIYLGKIAKWNAPEITSLNPGVKLPDSVITVVYRSDGSGTTFVWTSYLSKVSADFKTTVGAENSVKWPVGTGAKGNDGVAANVKQFKNSIGYVEYAFAKKGNLAYTSLKNADGQWVLPDDETFKAAAANADWAKTPGFAVDLTNQPGKATWPVTSATFIIVQKTQADAAKGKEILKFFDWAYKNGSPAAAELEFSFLPPSVIKLVQESWKVKVKDASGKAIW